jgi:serine/threonine protein kinase
MQETIKFVPDTATINKDRSYFIRGDIFVKVDNVIERGRNEAMILSSLDHPHIQKYIRSYEKDNLHYLETEYFRGPSLENTILSSEEKRRVQSQLFVVLAFLTTKNIAHKDINVSNILFNGEHILLIDWETAEYNNPIQDLFGKLEHMGILNVLKKISNE